MATQRQIAANRANRKRWRRHSLSGLRRLRQAAIRNRPWEQSTGPRTQAGKNRSKRNALKHGCFSAEVRASQRLMADLMKRISSVIGTPKTKLQSRLKKARKMVRSGYRSPARDVWGQVARFGVQADRIVPLPSKRGTNTASGARWPTRPAS